MSAKTTYELTADKQIKVGNCYLCALTVITDGANDATVVLYDVAASGDIAATNKLAEIKVIGTSHFGGRTFFEPVQCSTGIYADVTGTGASYIVEWRQ